MGWFIAWLWQGVLVVGLVALMFRMTSRISAATRYAIWWVTLAVVIGLPWLVVPGPSAGTDLVQTAPPVSALMPTLIELPGPSVELWIGAILCWLAVVALRLACLAGGLRGLIVLKRRCVALPQATEASLHRWTSVCATAAGEFAW